MQVDNISINPLYADRHFHCYMLDESICHFRELGSIQFLDYANYRVIFRILERSLNPNAGSLYIFYTFKLLLQHKVGKSQQILETFSP